MPAISHVREALKRAITPEEQLAVHQARVLDAARQLNASRIREPAFVEAVCSRVRELDDFLALHSSTIAERTKWRDAQAERRAKVGRPRKYPPSQSPGESHANE